MKLRRKSKLKVLTETAKRPGKAAKGFTALQVAKRPRKAAKGFAALQIAKRPRKTAKGVAALQSAKRTPVAKRLPIVAGAALAAFGASKALRSGGQTA